MVVVVLLSLIVLALMAVFNATQTAFRASVTQAGILESGRASMDLMADDLRAMAPSLSRSNAIVFDPFNVTNNVNFFSAVTSFATPAPPSPLVQPMVGGSSVRINVLENFFVLSKNNINGTTSWIGTGYAVNTNLPDGTPYPLYRFNMITNVMIGTPASLFNNFAALQFTNSNIWSHLMDGVVNLTVRAYDVNGGQMTNNITYSGGQIATNKNVLYFPSGPPALGQVGFVMFSNTLPASVEIEMGVLEDRALQRAESIPNPVIQSNYLVGSAGQVHVFRQRVSIPNVDPSAYQ